MRYEDARLFYLVLTDGQKQDIPIEECRQYSSEALEAILDYILDDESIDLITNNVACNTLSTITEILAERDPMPQKTTKESLREFYKNYLGIDYDELHRD